MRIYVLDSNILINMKNNYPPEFFEPLWELITELNNDGRLIIIKSVKEESNRGNDYLSNQFFEDKQIVDDRRVPDVVNGSLRIIIKSLPANNRGSLGIWLKEADPWIIAYSLYLKNRNEDVKILTDERPKENSLKIPTISQLHNIECINLFDFFREEGVKFDIR